MRLRAGTLHTGARPRMFPLHVPQCSHSECEGLYSVDARLLSATVQCSYDFVI